MIARKDMTQTIRSIEQELSATFAGIEAKYGYKLKFGRGSYDPEGNFHIKLEASKVGAKSKEAQEYEFRQSLNDALPPLNTRFNLGQNEYEIIGMNTRGTKVLGKRDGKTYLLPVRNVEFFWKLAQNKV